MGKWLPGISRRSRTHIQARVSRLGADMSGDPRPEFRAELRERLMNAAEEDLPAEPVAAGVPDVPVRAR
ncbi:hypothetical protein ACFQ08_26625, partial [Streptosporangium algeriense]